MTQPHGRRAGSAPQGPGRHHNVRMYVGTDPRSRFALLALPLASVAGFVLCVALDVRTPERTVGVELAPEPGWSLALTGVVLACLAALILLREPAQRFGWALALLGLFWTLDGVAQSYVRAGITDGAAWPGMTLVVWFLFRFTGFLPVATGLLLLLFPTGRLLTGWAGHVGRASVGVMVAAVLWVIVAPSAPEDVRGLPADVDPDLTTLPVPESWIPLLDGLFVAGIVAFFVAMGLVVVRYRRSTGLEQDRMRWLLWSVVVVALALGASAVLGSAGLTTASLFLLVVLPAAAMTVAIVHPDIVSIDELLTSTLVYGLLSAGIVVVDLVALWALTSVLDDSLERGQVVLVVLLLSALVYGPLRDRLRRGVRRAMLGQRDNPYGVMAGLASSLETADEGSGQLATIASAVASAFGVAYVSVEVDRSRGEKLVATRGERPAETRTLPITYRDAEVGRLVLPAHGARARLSARDERLLGDLVRQAAAAARATRLADDLQDSRERLVVAREEERRRIRRDLHDGLGPALGGVVFRLESARMLVETDPVAAQSHLAVTRDHVQDVIADVRRLVHDLRPPALDDRGLRGALVQQAEGLRDSGLDVTLDADGVEALPAAVEVAAFRIVGEALANTVRHARAARSDVRLRVVDDHLEVEVSDDGVGIPVEAEVGVGLLSLRERAAELGGRSEIVCPPDGGTVVRAWLPLRSAS